MTHNSRRNRSRMPILCSLFRFESASMTVSTRIRVTQMILKTATCGNLNTVFDQPHQTGRAEKGL